jgi:hypothetical protein
VFVRATHLFIISAAVVGTLTGTTYHASAKGTVVVTQSDGSHKVYHNVFIRVRGNAMSLESSDRKRTLITGKADCTQVNHLLRCIVYDATLNELGGAHHLDLRSGTLWLDLSAKPHGARLSLQTKAGTTVSANGTLDEFQQ